MTLAPPLAALAAHTRKWSPKINLVAKSTLAAVEQRHIADSAQLAPLIPDTQARIVDLGSGGGFPGLVLVALGYSQVTLVDSDQRKISACRAFLRQQGLQARLIAGRIETLREGDFDVVTARALAALDQLLTWAVPLLAPGGRCLFLKGARIDQELKAAQARFDFSYAKHPPVSAPGDFSGGCVLEVRDARIRQKTNAP